MLIKNMIVLKFNLDQASDIMEAVARCICSTFATVKLSTISNDERLIAIVLELPLIPPTRDVQNDTKISSQASAEWRRRRRRRRFFKNALKENLAKLIQLMEKLQMFFIGNGIKLSILLPHAISTRRRRRATNPGRFVRYVARKMSFSLVFIATFSNG